MNHRTKGQSQKLESSKRTKSYGYDVIEDSHDVSFLLHEIGTCPQVEEYLKLFDDAPFCVCPYVLKEVQCDK